MPEPLKKISDKVPAIEVRNCTVNFGPVKVVDGVSFEIRQGSVCALIGPNGSGKTTLLKAILGLLPVESGDILIFGKHLHSMRKMIGYVPQRFDFDRNFPITVREFLDIARQLHCQEHFPQVRILEKIKEVGLPPTVLDQHLGELSGGQLQRVLVAQAIINDPAILFLDEPASGIDIAGEATLFGIIEHLNRDHDTTVILVSHDIAMISGLVDSVVCINRKLLCYGPPRIALTERKIAEVFGDRDTYFEHRHGHDHGGPERHR